MMALTMREVRSSLCAGLTFFAGLCVLAVPAMAEIEIQEVISPKGHTAWMVEDHSIPFVALEIAFRGGTSLDSAEKGGATYLMAGLLEEGSGDLPAQEYARVLESLAASFAYDVDRDSLSISARFLSENSDEAVELLRQTLTDPRFDQDALDRVRAQVLAGLRSDAKDPNDIAGRVLAEQAFGNDPYGRAEKGNIETVSALTRQDMFDAHEAALATDRVFVSAVGDITAEQLGEILDEVLEGLPETGGDLPGPVSVGLTGGITIVDYDTPQSVALFGHAGIERDDPRFFAAFTMNQILGGGSFESRLMTEVREKRGLTYGAYAYLVPRDRAALYMGSFASANSKMAEAVEVTKGEWQRMAIEGVTSQELQDAKTYLTGAYPLRFDGNGRIASILVGMQLDGLPMDYVLTRNDNIEAITLDEINNVASEILQPDNLRFVVVGRPEGLESEN